MALRHAVERELAPAGVAGQVHAMRAAVEFRVDVAYEAGGVRVCPVGDIDLATVGRLRDGIDEALTAGAQRVILDLRRTTFLDSAGLHLAQDVARRTARIGTELAIIPGPPAVQRVFEIAGLSGLPFVDVPAAWTSRVTTIG